MKSMIAITCLALMLGAAQQAQSSKTLTATTTGTAKMAERPVAGSYPRWWQPKRCYHRHCGTQH